MPLPHFIFWITPRKIKYEPILIIFGVQNRDEISHQKIWFWTPPPHPNNVKHSPVWSAFGKVIADIKRYTFMSHDVQTISCLPIKVGYQLLCDVDLPALAWHHISLRYYSSHSRYGRNPCEWVAIAYVYSKWSWIWYICCSPLPLSVSGFDIIWDGARLPKAIQTHWIIALRLGHCK